MANASDDRLPRTEIGERRAAGRLIAHWRQSRKDAALPTLHDLTLNANPGLREASFLLLIGDAPESSIVVLCGERVGFADLHAALGKSLSSMRQTVVRDALYRLSSEAKTAHRPAYLAGTYWETPDRLAHYRLCCVPLRADDAPIPAFSYVLGSFTRKLAPPRRP